MRFFRFCESRINDALLARARVGTQDRPEWPVLMEMARGEMAGMVGGEGVFGRGETHLRNNICEVAFQVRLDFSGPERKVLRDFEGVRFEEHGRFGYRYKEKNNTRRTRTRGGWEGCVDSFRKGIWNSGSTVEQNLEHRKIYASPILLFGIRRADHSLIISPS